MWQVNIQEGCWMWQVNSSRHQLVFFLFFRCRRRDAKTSPAKIRSLRPSELSARMSYHTQSSPDYWSGFCYPEQRTAHEGEREVCGPSERQPGRAGFLQETAMPGFSFGCGLALFRELIAFAGGARFALVFSKLEDTDTAKSLALLLPALLIFAIPGTAIICAHSAAGGTWMPDGLADSTAGCLTDRLDAPKPCIIC